MNRNGNQKWVKFQRNREALVISSNDLKKKGINDSEIVNMMKKRQQTMPNYGTEYRTIHEDIRNKLELGKCGMAQHKIRRNRKKEYHK